jgi:hypothetical protein
LIFEKSGAWKGSVLGRANGLDAARWAGAAADAFFGAEIALADVATAMAAVASKSLRIMRLPT